MSTFFSRLILILLALTPLSVFAKAINLYEEPQDKAKVLTTVDSDQGIIPIYTPDKGDWIKVADPKNGNVGWVKVKDLGSNGNSEYTFTQRFINTGSAPQTYQIIQFGNANKMTPEQVETLLKQNRLQQQQIQDNMNKAMQNMMNQMNNLYHMNSNGFNNGVPFIMPVLVIPAPSLPAAAPADKTKATKKSDKNN